MIKTRFPFVSGCQRKQIDKILTPNTGDVYVISRVKFARYDSYKWSNCHTQTFEGISSNIDTASNVWKVMINLILNQNVWARY